MNVAIVGLGPVERTNGNTIVILVRIVERILGIN